MSTDNVKGRAVPGNRRVIMADGSIRLPENLPANQWVGRLPGSNQAAWLTRPNLFAMASQIDDLPNPLAMAILRMAKPNEAEDLTLDAKQREVKAMRAVAGNIQNLFLIAQACLVEPRLVLEGDPKPGEIDPSALGLKDLEFIYYSWVEGNAHLLEIFRHKPKVEEPVDPKKSGSNSPALQLVPSPPPGDS